MSKILSLYTNLPQAFFEKLPKEIKEDERLHDGHKAIYLLLIDQYKRHGYLLSTYEALKDFLGLSIDSISNILNDLRRCNYIEKNESGKWKIKEESKRPKTYTPEEIIYYLDKSIESNFICITNLKKLFRGFELPFERNPNIKIYSFGRKKVVAKQEAIDFLKRKLLACDY